ncbi:MAG: DUF192 domain-containing protein [Bacillota bacterium]|nr:DUF192 domain-containing protein [Bacillota bacterium]
MRCCKAIIEDTVIAYNVKIADSFFKRLVGLLNRDKLEDDEGLLLKKCNQIHTIGMRFNIDAVFLNKEGEIVYIEKDMGAGKISKRIKNACQVLELQAGTADKYNIKLFDVIKFDVLL